MSGEITRLDLLASQMDMPALTPELQTPQKTFGFNLSFWKLCLEARRIRNEERKLAIGFQSKKTVEDKPKPVVLKPIEQSTRPAGSFGGK